MSEVKERNQQRRDGTEGQGHWKQGGRDGLGHFTLFNVAHTILCKGGVASDTARTWAQRFPHFTQKHFLSQHILPCSGQWPLHPSQASDGHEGSLGTCTSIASVPSEAGNMLM